MCLPVGIVRLGRLQDFCAALRGIRDQPFQPRIVTVGNDRGVVLVGGIGAEHAPHLRAHLFGEGLQRAPRNQYIIRRDAGLPGIEQFSVGDALGRLVEIG